MGDRGRGGLFSKETILKLEKNEVTVAKTGILMP